MYTQGRKDTDASEATHAMWKVCVSNKNVIFVCIGVTKECLKTIKSIRSFYLEECTILPKCRLIGLLNNAIICMRMLVK